MEENDCAFSVGDEAVELASEEDISGDESGVALVLGDSGGDVEQV